MMLGFFFPATYTHLSTLWAKDKILGMFMNRQTLLLNQSMSINTKPMTCGKTLTMLISWNVCASAENFNYLVFLYMSLQLCDSTTYQTAING